MELTFHVYDGGHPDCCLCVVPSFETQLLVRRVYHKLISANAPGVNHLVQFYHSAVALLVRFHEEEEDWNGDGYLYSHRRNRENQ